jgi:hypothetical protein
MIPVINAPAVQNIAKIETNISPLTAFAFPYTQAIEREGREKTYQDFRPHVLHTS